MVDSFEVNQCQTLVGRVVVGNGFFKSLEVIQDENNLYSMRFYDHEACGGATVGYVPEQTQGGCREGECCIGTWFVGTQQHFGFIPGRVSDMTFKNECDGKSESHGGRTAVIVIVILLALGGVAAGVYVFLKKRGGYTSF